MVFVPMAQAPCKAGAKELYSLNLIHESTSLFSPKVIFAGLPQKAFPRKHAFVDISVFLWLRKQRPRFAQGQPKGYFQTKKHPTAKIRQRPARAIFKCKSLIELLKLLSH